MRKKCFTLFCIALLATLILAAPAMAQTAKKFAVLPFSYNGPKKYSYFPKAFQANLSSSLEWAGHATTAPDAVLEELVAPKGTADAINIAQGAGLDYLISGTISILDKQATLSINAVGTDGKTWENKGQMGIDEITPWLEEQSRSIQGDVFQRPGYGTAVKDDTPEAAATKAAPTNPAFVAAEGGAYQESNLNPQFRYEGGTESKGRWRSQTMRFSSNSMLVLDADGDGKNEVIILQKNGISAFRFAEGKLEHLATMPLTSNTEYLRLEYIDLERDGLPEFVVGSYQMEYRIQTLAPEGTPKSHILTFRDGKFNFLLKNYKRFLGVLRIPPTYTPILVTQAKGQRHLFAKRIEEAYYKNGEIVRGQVIPSPEFGNVYNMAYIPVEMGYRYVVIDDFHRLKVYSQTLEPLSSSDEDRFNSSGIGLAYSNRQVGMGPGLTDEKVDVYNVPMRMLVASLSNKGSRELLVNKDLSVAAQIFQRYKYFSQGEIHALVWDGVGLNLAWKTRRIKGQVSDYAVADINNDGKKQLCVLLNTFPGGLGFLHRKTIVLAYDLNLPE